MPDIRQGVNSPLRVSRLREFGEASREVREVLGVRWQRCEGEALASATPLLETCAGGKGFDSPAPEFVRVEASGKRCGAYASRRTPRRYRDARRAKEGRYPYRPAPRSGAPGIELRPATRAGFDSGGVIHGKHRYRCSPASCLAKNFARDSQKVLLPSISPWMKKHRDRCAYRINTCEIWPLVRVTKMAGQRKVSGLISASVLPGNNVLNVKSQPRLTPFTYPAILTTVTRP